MLAVGAFVTHSLLSCYLYAEFCSLTSLWMHLPACRVCLFMTARCGFAMATTGVTRSGEIHAG